MANMNRRDHCDAGGCDLGRTLIMFVGLQFPVMLIAPHTN